MNVVGQGRGLQLQSIRALACSGVRCLWLGFHFLQHTLVVGRHDLNALLEELGPLVECFLPVYC